MNIGVASPIKKQKHRIIIRGNPQLATRITIPAPMAAPMQVVQRSFRVSAGKRPVDKLLLNINKGGVTATQVATVLVTATFPCTIVGLRWDMTFATVGGTGLGGYSWAIIILRDGVTVSQMAHTDGSTLYAPEQDVMAFGRGFNTALALGMLSKYQGSTKTMRKLMGGDKLQFIIKGTDTDTVTVQGCIQFFCKS